MLSSDANKYRQRYLIEAEKLCPNEQQWAAYNSHGHCVILAGPGSGKTKTLVTKVARMLHEEIHTPRGVACVTFNNECVRQLERRLEELDVFPKENLFVGTVHSFCLRQIIIPYAKLGGIALPIPISIATSRERQDALAEASARVSHRNTVGISIANLDRIRKLYLGPHHHNPLDQLARARQASGVQGGRAIMTVDRVPCAACYPNGGIRSGVRAAGLDELEVMYPGGSIIIKP